jgi:mono/diheme cytochrome c family protein
MNRYTTALVATIALVGSYVPAHAQTAATFKTKILPILESHCSKCHGPNKKEAEINLSGERSLEKLTGDQHLWFRVLDQLEFGQMPPEGEKKLADADRKAVVDWIKGELTDSFAAKRLSEGRSPFRRLSRAEYADNFEDLFGIRLTGKMFNMLPEDGRVEGYTKVSQALPLSTDGAYGYYQIARTLLDQWVLRPIPKIDDDSKMARLTARDTGQSAGHALELPDGWFVYFNSDDTSGRLVAEGQKTGGFRARSPGVYRLRANIYAYQTDMPLTVGIYTGHTAAYPQQIDLVQIIEAPPGKPTVVETEVYLGVHRSGQNGLRLIPFGIGEQVPKNSLASKCKGPGLAVQWVEVEHPPLPAADRWLTADFPEALQEAMRKPMPTLKGKRRKDPDLMSAADFTALMRKTLARVGARMWRRDLTSQELDKMTDAVMQDLGQNRNIKEIFFNRIADLMTAPDFYCVVESPGPLSDMALASRLSLFLWNSSPDDALLAVARQGKLRSSDILRRETDRLLDDPRSDKFVSNFLNQWLDLHAISDTTPDNKLYREYGDDLKFSSMRETEGTFRHILRENRSVRDFAAPDWMLVNGRLARHYELPEVKGATLQQVKLPADSPYGGLWTQPAVLKVTADGSSTSPVKRGVWIAKRLLGVSVSPPPPNIEPINPDTSGAKTLREQLALHSTDSSCAGCHKKFDPYGFALESFDVMGQFRTNYRTLDPKFSGLKPFQRERTVLWMDGLPVDPSGITPEGQPFDNIIGLRNLLSQQPEKFAWGVTTHLLTYATGEASSPLDRKAIQQIVDSAKPNDYGLRSLVHGLVQSETFRSK